MGLLSHTISVQKSQESMPLILERRGRNKEEKEQGGARREGDGSGRLVCLVPGAGERGEG